MRGKPIRPAIRFLTGLLFAAALLLLAVFFVPAQANAVIGNGVAGGSAAAPAVDFTPFVITSVLSGPYTVTFAGAHYTPTDADSTAFTDADPSADGIQVALADIEFLPFKIVPDEGYTFTNVSLAANTATGGTMAAHLYGPTNAGVYTVSNVNDTTGNQTVTVTTAQSLIITYDANGGVGTAQPVNTAAGQSVVAAFPANIGITPPANQYFSGWNAASDGSGTTYAAGTEIANVSTSLTLYAQWTSAAAPFTARLYDNANYATSAYTVLTEGGAVGNGWASSYPTRYLVIVANFTGKNGGTISITLPTGMALYNDNYTKMSEHPNMVNEPVFVTYDEDTVADGYQQGTGTYSNTRTGTLTYTFSTAATAETLTIPVTFDQTIWDRSTGLANLSGEKPAITVTMTPCTGMSSTKTLSKVLSSGGTGPFIYPDYWPDNVPIGDERVSMSYTSVRNADTYWRTLTMEYILPHKTTQEGEVIYAEYVGESQSGDTALNSYTLVLTTAGYTVDSSDPTKLVYTWTDHKQNNFIYLSPVLKFPAEKFSDGEGLKFTVILTGETYSGAVITNTVNCPITVVDKKSKVTLNTAAKSVCQTSYPAEVRNILGSLSLKNTGLVDSGKQQVTFTFDSGNAAGSGHHNIDVSAFSLPQTNLLGLTPSTFSAICTMVNANNDRSFTYEMTGLSKGAPYTPTQYGCLLLASDVVTAYNAAHPGSATGDWYFKTVTYVIPRIPSSTTLYYPTAPSAFDYPIPSGGNFYGRINATATSTLEVKELVAEPDTWGTATTASINSNKTNVRTTGLYVGDVTLNGSSGSKTITAGDSLTMTVPLQMHNYPYGNTQYSQNPVFYFIAPVGVTIPFGGVSAAWSDDSADAITTVVTSRPVAVAAGNTAYKVEFNGTAAFGGPMLRNNKLMGADKTRYPILTLTLNTAAGMDASSLLLQNNLFVTEAGGDVNINSDYHITDTYDLDEDGSTDDKLGRITNKTLSIVIAPNTKQLTFTAQAKMADEADSAYRSGTDTANRLYLSSPGDHVNYRLTLQNDSGIIVPAGNFMYYIPIPRTGTNNAMHAHMVQNNTSPGFDLTLTGPVSITGTNPGLFDLRYSTDATVSNYNNGYANYDYPSGGATWRNEADMTAAVAAGTASWDDVRMIKLVAADIDQNSYIPTDTLTQFTLTLAYTGNAGNILQNAGATSVWCCCGAQKYLITGELSNGTHTPTEFVTVMLRSEAPHSITLTAAQRMTPTSPAVNAVAIPLPAYTIAEEIKLLSVVTENVVLRDSTTVTDNAATATGEFANGCFAITAKLDGGTACELSGGANQSLGLTTANAASTLALRLYNYDALSDVTTPRNVTLVLGDGTGVQITITITIARELATVLSASPHIEGGKSYQLLHGEADSATIRQDSAFTAQYALTSVAPNTDHVLSLLSGQTPVNFPLGTALTLINLTNVEAPQYYFLQLTSATSTVNLASFANMDHGGSNYAPAASSADETLLLIADFAAAPLATGNYTLRLSLGNGAMHFDRNVIVSSARSFSLTAATAAAIVSDSITVNGTAATTATGSVSDSRWVYRKMALVVTLKNGDVVTPFPAGTIVTMGGEQYVPSRNAVILPLGSIGTHDYSYTVTTPLTRLPANSYTLCTELFISATASAEAPMGGKMVDEKTCGFTVAHADEYAIKLDMDNNQHLFTKADAASIALHISHSALTSGRAITLELQEKVNGVYLTRTNLITGATINSTPYIVNGFGVIQLPSRAPQTTSFEVTLNLNSNHLVAGNTYRILAKVVSADESIETTYNIVIVE